MIEENARIIKSIEDSITKMLEEFGCNFIAKATEISYTTVNELKRGIRNLDNVSFGNVMKLYDFSLKCSNMDKQLKKGLIDEKNYK